MADQVVIDPQTGERITAGSIDPATGERIAAPQRGALGSFADASGLSALAHPIDAIMGIPGAVKQAGANIADAYSAVKKEGINDDSRRSIGRAVPIVGPALSLAQDQYDAGNKAGAFGTVAGTVAGLVGPKALKGAGEMAPTLGEATQSTAEALQKVGGAAQDAGNKLVNETVGAYKTDFKRGANPGRGYNSTGQGISWTMRGLADKAETAKATIGSNIQRVIDASGAKDAMIPVNDVLEALAKPLKEAHDAETEAGGMGNTAAFEQYAQQFKKSIADGLKRGGFTAQDVFDLKKKIAAKAKFNNTTPEGIMDVRQSQVGALGGLLKGVIPELAPLNQAYQDLVKLSDRATWRAESGSVPLRRLITEGGKGAAAAATGIAGGAHEGMGAYAVLSALDSTAGRTAIATGLHGAGESFTKAGHYLEDWWSSKKKVGSPPAPNAVPTEAASHGKSPIPEREYRPTQGAENTNLDFAGHFIPKEGPPGFDNWKFSDNGSHFEVFRDSKGVKRGFLEVPTNPETGQVDPSRGLNVWIDPAYRRQGIATKLYENAASRGYDLSKADASQLTADGAALRNGIIAKRKSK